MKKFILLFLTAFSLNTYAITGDELYQELIDFLFESASSLSHYSMYPKEHRPLILKKTKQQMQQEICPTALAADAKHKPLVTDAIDTFLTKPRPEFTPTDADNVYSTHEPEGKVLICVTRLPVPEAGPAAPAK
jgi:hypothetical protein